MKKMIMMMIFNSCTVVIANKCSISCYTCTTAADVCTSVFMLSISSKCFSIHVMIVVIANLCQLHHLLIIN